MMASDERKLATSPLIPLEIDPASILSLSKGVIFDTIVHNIECTLNNRRTDPLPWNLTGMSLICDPNRNKKYMQKLQKMQCVPSAIRTQIYHSKLIKTESGLLTTPGQKIVLATTPRKRLTGVLVCRSIDELLYMESPNTENVHIVQYKLLSYERIVTRELVNGPKLSTVGDKIIKTVFDFEVTQNNAFPRQLLPVAIISFLRQTDCDLCSSIRSFLKLEEHQIFDKSYLVTSKNDEIEHLREEQERKEDADIEQEIAWEKLQRRQPLADLSKKSIETGNARPTPMTPASLRVPPLKIKLSRPEKSVKPLPSLPPLEFKFRCTIKLERIDLSQYNISSVPILLPTKPKKLNESPIPSVPIPNRNKSLTITKPHEHQKALKRLSTSDTNKHSSSSTEISREKANDELISICSSTSDTHVPMMEDKPNQRSTSTSSMSPIYRPKPPTLKGTVDKTLMKKKVKRPILPSEYRCSLSMTRIDLSIYDLDLPTFATSPSTLPMEVEPTVISSPSGSGSSEQRQTESMNLPIEPVNSQDAIQSIFMMEQEAISDNRQFDDINTSEVIPNIMDEFFISDLNEPLSIIIDNEVSLSGMDDILPESINEPVTMITTDEHPALATNETEPVNEELPKVPPETNNDVQIPATNDDPSTSRNEERLKLSSPVPCVPFSPGLPTLDDDSFLLSLKSPPQICAVDHVDTAASQDYIIIVPCSDDEDAQTDDNGNDCNTNHTETKTVKFASPFSDNKVCPILPNPSVMRVLTSGSPLGSHRSSTSSCSSISTSILHNQSPRTPLQLTEIFLSQKILKKRQPKPLQPIIFSRLNICIPFLAQEPMVDPRLIYRLQTITTDLRWMNPCNQCSMSEHAPSLPPPPPPSAQILSSDQNGSSDCMDPRRDALKNAILNNIYERMRILLPHFDVIDSNQFEKLLFEETVFKTNCSIHLEYLLYKIQLTDDENFLHVIKNNDEFQLSALLIQLIF